MIGQNLLICFSKVTLNPIFLLIFLMSRPKGKLQIMIPVKILYDKYSIISKNPITNQGRGFLGNLQSEGTNLPNLINSQ